jgi:prepilin-type N-terminal cleavage/methylation domain-containing protein
MVMTRQPTTAAKALPLIRNQAGFSLIEIIAVLVLLGIMGVGMGFGISHIVKGYVLSRESVVVAGKAQLALLRMSREFKLIDAISVDPGASDQQISFTTDDDGDVATARRVCVLALVNDTITLNGDILVDQVDSWSLAYYDTFDGTPETTWSANRAIIQVTITMKGPDNILIPFSTRVTPRNI